MTTRRPPGQNEVSDEEARFLASYDPNDYERLSVAVDVVLISAFDGDLFTLLSRRQEHPHRNRWALPGGFVRPRSRWRSRPRASWRARAGSRACSSSSSTPSATRSATRAPGWSRSPTSRSSSRQRFAKVGDRNPDIITPRLRVPWEGESGGPVEALGADGRPLPLAFDHAEMLGTAVKRLRGKLDYAPIGFELLGDTFTLLELQRVHEAVLGRSVNKDSFRRRMLSTGLLKATGKSQSGVVHRPAELYRFARRPKE